MVLILCSFLLCTTQQNEENAVDCSWWMDVEKLASQVEGQLG